MELANLPFKVCPTCGCSSIEDQREHQRRGEHEQRRTWECGLRVMWQRSLATEDWQIWQEAPCQTAHRESTKGLKVERDVLQGKQEELYAEATKLYGQINELDNRLCPLNKMIQLDAIGNPIPGTEL